jgi:8-oxo-dGTP pyrophosphatase MutT (NUDIX family)
MIFPVCAARRELLEELEEQHKKCCFCRILIGKSTLSRKFGRQRQTEGDFF